MFMKKRLAYKFSVSILSAVLLIFFLILSYNYFISRKLILKNVRENTKNLTSSAINKSEGFFRVIEKITQNTSYLIQYSEKSEKEINFILSTIIKKNDEIYGSCMAFEPYMFKNDIKYFAPYFYKKGDSLLFKNLANSNYFYPDWDWYRNSIEQGKPVWSEPYFDKGGGNLIMATYSVPFYNQNAGNSSICGVITTDISLKWLQKIVSQIKIFKTGYAFLISQKGTFITFPDTNYVMYESIFTLAKKFHDPELKKIGEEMIAGHEDFVPINSEFHGGKCWVYYTHLSNNNWSLGFVFPEKELYADLYKLNQTLVIMAIIGLALLFILIIIISNRVTKPLHSLAIAAKSLGTGNFDMDIPFSNASDEVGSLNKSFVQMQAALKKYIENLRLTTSAKEKIESELKIARDIQMGMIPRIFPAFPDRKEFDIFGFIEPAKEVGGDLYDFFFIDDEHLCFAIGDVAGKGMPAALFMAITTTILRAETQVAGLNLSKVIELMNNYLCKDNDNNLFVTLFLGIMNTSTGELEFANAGHNYPFVVKKNGSIVELNNTRCIPLGIQMNLCNKTSSFTLDAWDLIFLYTDGISEAFNTENTEYSISRISEVLQNSVNQSPNETVNKVVSDVKRFAQGTEQSDDISVLAIRFLGTQFISNPKESCQYVVNNSVKDISTLLDKISILCQDWKIPSDICNRVKIVAEELIVNTINYGYSDTFQHAIILNLVNGANSITLEIIDDGNEFNPIFNESADVESKISERKIGGLGIHLVKNLTDSFTYRREGEKNITKILIRY